MLMRQSRLSDNDRASSQSHIGLYRNQTSAVTEQPHTLPPGTRLDRYRLHQVLGVGGFGITYQAIDLSQDCLVAIKEYFPAHLAVRTSNSLHIQPKTRADTAMYEFGLQRFMDEARLLARFTDPNIVHVRGYIEDNGSAYIIMDYEEGLPLSRYLMRCTTLTELEIRRVFQPILNGLHKVHAIHYLHCDIKPSNIFLRSAGSPVLLDFGAARRAVNDPGREVSNPGTYYYAPYEQFTSSEQQGPWTDIYSVGATLYHCLTGQAPTPALDRISAVHANRPDPLLPAVLACRGRYSMDLLDCVDRMLQLRTGDRPQCTEELVSVFASPDERSGTVTILSDNEVDRDEELIILAERHLAEYLGTLAGVIVGQTLKRARNVEELYLALSRHIDNNEGRRQFLKSVTACASNTSPRNPRTQSPAVPVTMHLSGPNAATSPRSIDEAVTEKLIRQLSYHIGPKAHLLVRRAIEANYDLEQIIDILARELPDEAERERFRKQFAFI